MQLNWIWIFPGKDFCTTPSERKEVLALDSLALCLTRNKLLSVCSQLAATIRRIFLLP